MQVLSASSLIRDSLLQTEGQHPSQDHLRARSIEGNQAALLEAFNRHTDPDKTLVILDAHVVIDTPDGLVRISSDVFREIDPDFVVFIKDEPRRIHLNRNRDISRERPERSVASLAKQQEIAIAAARDIANGLNIPIHFVDGGDDEALSRVLSAVQEAEPNV
ncbi:AAA family ATPase (plasmid) [Falsihalocynthiibacter sp. SS001]|uniref:AAA family ATPase n=1 Tax=Falsihalocynthiibacter sp. SS001 TaxID=3349698 RepID=UPI0036D42DEF